MRPISILVLTGLLSTSCLQPSIPELPAAARPGEDGRYKLWVFTDPLCPIANGYSPDLRELQQQTGDLPLDWLLVYCDPQVTAAETLAHSQRFDLAIPRYIDHDHRLLRQAGASTTPEVALWGRQGALLYRGRIDNSYGALSRKRPAPTRFELRDAIEALRNSRPIRVPRTEAVGCEIQPLPTAALPSGR